MAKRCVEHFVYGYKQRLNDALNILSSGYKQRLNDALNILSSGYKQRLNDALKLVDINKG